MNKIYLSTLLTLFSISLFAQQKVASEHGEAIPALQEENAQRGGNIIWSEDFSGGIPATWTNTTVAGPVDWKYTTVGHTGAYPTAALASTTAANGWIIVDSDADNSSGGNPEDARLVTERIDLTGFTNVKLQFEQMFRRWQNDITTVSLSTDSVSWTDFVLNGSITQTGTPNPDLVNIDISGVAANSDTLYIMFWWQGAWDYGWQVDDISVREILSNDVSIKNEAFHSIVEYYMTPTTQVTALTFSATVENVGLASQTNVGITLDLNDGASSVFSGTSNLVPSLSPFTDDSVTVGGTYTPSGIHTYTATYNAIQDETDDEPSNNMNALIFQTTDTVYAIDNDIYGGQWWNQETTPGNSAPFHIGAIYEIYNDEDVSSFSVFVGDQSTVGVPFLIKIYEFEAATGAWNWLAETDIFTVTAPELGTWVTYPPLQATSLLAGTTYMVAVEHFGGPDALYIGYGTNSARGYTQSSDDGATWNNQPRCPMLRLNLDAPVGIGENENNTILVGQNMPNPSNGITQINYSLTEMADVTLNIVDLAGKTVMHLDRGTVAEGSHTINLNAENLSEGAYFYTLTANGYSVTKKMIIAK
jgi:hypothetical protein